MNTEARKRSSQQKAKQIVFLIILWIFLFWIFACWAIWDGGYTLTALAYPNPPRWKPLENDIVGKWKLSDASIKTIESSGAQVPFHEIEFLIDGTFIATNFPDTREWSDEKIVLEFYTGMGTWKIDRLLLRPWSVRLYYDEYGQLFQSGESYFLIGKMPPYKMDATPLIFERK
jgi:hypothetical protein